MKMPIIKIETIIKAEKKVVFDLSRSIDLQVINDINLELKTK